MCQSIKVYQERQRERGGRNMPETKFTFLYIYIVDSVVPLVHGAAGVASASARLRRCLINLWIDIRILSFRFSLSITGLGAFKRWPLSRLSLLLLFSSFFFRFASILYFFCGFLVISSSRSDDVARSSQSSTATRQ